MTAFKRPGSAIGRLSTAASPAGGMILPAIGEAYGGGYFAGVWMVDGKSYALIASPASAESTSYTYKDADTFTSGAVSPTDGAANTLALDNANHPAGNYCADLTLNGKSDWYLPAINELVQIYMCGPFMPSGQELNGQYWSSTQTTTATARTFNAVTIESTNKTSAGLRTRAVRRVRL